MWYRKYHTQRFFRHLLAGPFIRAPLVFALILDIFVELYHHIAFPLYGLEKVKRSDYIAIMDRTKLEYLRRYQKLFCMYCGYMNGVFEYRSEIAHRTESYWCGIMHQGRLKDKEYQKTYDFVPYGDKKAFKEKYKPSRAR